MTTPAERRILDAVDEAFDAEVAFLADLVRRPSTRGEETSAQDLVEDALRARGLAVDRWRIDHCEIEHLPGFSPVRERDVAGENVVARIPAAGAGRSLVLNAHVDVVPTGPAGMWSRAPFSADVADGWMYGRGAGDMKAGLASNLFALDAVRAAGLRPAGEVVFQSVVDEECTGNGALACRARGFVGDAVLIPEPFDEMLVTAQVGVLWFGVHVRGLPTHVAYAGAGSNAIEAAMPLVEALRGLERRWNAPDRRTPDFAGHDRALVLNVGRIRGGDWPSSVPAWCVMDCRMGLFPGQDVEAAKADIEATVAEAARATPFLASHPPEVVWEGFRAEGYALSSDEGPVARAAVATLESGHRDVTGAPLARGPITATTDARQFALHGGVPVLVYGPRAEAIHGFDERVDLASLARVTRTTALFIARWCGLMEG